MKILLYLKLQFEQKVESERELGKFGILVVLRNDEIYCKNEKTNIKNAKKEEKQPIKPYNNFNYNKKKQILYIRLAITQ